jgi:RNA polymerase sigma-70 factor (ECF subfamily)
MAATEVTDSANPTAQLDESAVAAVRGGDAERYRELVERHERRVYAVAWSRLGDAALAEEATQEAFIRAYRRLWLLGDGAKFSGWINTIARRVAINFGLRHRRELNKRERWALEHSDNPLEENTAAETNPLHTPETLRQTLAELPAAHRECLVLFYLEGRSGADAAAALGISEVALRVRLHRARTAMRERLEEKLAGSLTKLRPAKTLVPAVMAGVLASSSAKAAAGGTITAGVGAKIVSLLGKTFLFAWLMPLLWVIANLPSLMVASFIVRKERQNFRDAGGFRPELHRRFFRSFIWGFPLLLVAFVILDQSGLAAWGIKTDQFIVACFVSVLTLISARSLMICRNPFQVSMFAYCLIITAGLSALALGWIPSSMALLPLLTATIVFFLFYKKRPMRMDYSLFLRAAHGLLKLSAEADDLPPTNGFDRGELLVFARFLGSRFLVNNFRWETSGLLLRLPPVENRFLTNMAEVFLPPISQNCSQVLLGWDGTIRAHCGKADAQNLAALKTSGLTNPQELESLVEENVLQSWQEFRSGNLAAAERTLGDSPESEVFIVPPSRAKSMRWGRIFIGAFVLLMMAGMMLRFRPPAWMARLDGLKTVNVSEAQVRAALAGFGQASDGSSLSNGLYQFLCFGLVLPATNLFSSDGLQATRQEVFKAAGFDPHGALESKYERIGNAWLLGKALAGGWFSLNELGVDSGQMSEAFHHSNQYGWGLHFMLAQQRYSNEGKNCTVEQVDSLILAQLRLLQDVKCLDLVERAKIIPHLCALQVLSGEASADRARLSNWRDVRGLFYTPGRPALQDTYFDLAALEILGGLDKIDREACIEGILKRHAGKGYFTSPDSGGYNEYHIDGSARDTIAAFESLRILGALDRVKDLDKWQFRIASYRASKSDAKGVRILTWDEIEAWVCQQRLAKILRERKENPQAPFGSLLQPGAN